MAFAPFTSLMKYFAPLLILMVDALVSGASG